MNLMWNMLETKNFFQYFLINWFLQPVIGQEAFLLDTSERVKIHSLESIFEQCPLN